MEKFEPSPKLKAQSKRFSDRYFVFFACAFAAMVLALIAKALGQEWLIWVAISAFAICSISLFITWFIHAFRVIREWLTGPEEE